MIFILKTHLRKLVGDASGDAAAADYYCFSLWRERERERESEEARWRKSGSVCSFPLLHCLDGCWFSAWILKYEDSSTKASGRKLGAVLVGPMLSMGNQGGEEVTRCFLCTFEFVSGIFFNPVQFFLILSRTPIYLPFQSGFQETKQRCLLGREERS